MKQWTLEQFWAQKYWYHGTKKEYAIDIINNGPKVNKNLFKPSDFGKGLYLCPNKIWCQEYERKLLMATDLDNIINDDDGIIIKFYFDPTAFKNLRFKFYDTISDDFAKFVFHNWKHPYIPHPDRYNSFIFGPMSDGKQLYLMTALKNGEMQKEEVINELMKPKEDWQLVIKTQSICDKLQIIKTYNLKGDEVHVI